MMVEKNNKSSKAKGESMIYLLPGASATGRDFLLEQLLGNADVVGQRLGLGRPLNIAVAKKTTTRPSRSGVETLKICVDHDAFEDGLKKGEIIAPYTLESNGHKYGYHKASFENKDGADIMVSDASVYQIPALKKEFGSRVYASAMIATRGYRHDNLKIRGSEKPEEMQDRLNLGDAHVVIAMLMAPQSGKHYRDFVDPTFAGQVSDLIEKTRNGHDTKEAEKAVAVFSKSEIVPAMIKQLAANETPLIDHLVELQPIHRVTSGDNTPITQTQFSDLGVGMMQNVMNNGYQIA